MTRRPSVKALAIDLDGPGPEGAVCAEAPVFAAIDVGANAARLQIARRANGGTLETVHRDRCPVRPGEGVFTSQRISAPAEERLSLALERYREACDGLGATVRAVATSAFRQAVNAPEVVERILARSGIRLEVISPWEESRLICRGALAGTPRTVASLVVDVGGGSTEVVMARGALPVTFWSFPLGSLRLGADGSDGRELDLESWRQRIRRELGRASIGGARSGFARMLGTSGTLRAAVRFASGGQSRADRRQVTRAVGELVSLGVSGRAAFFQGGRADTVLPGTVILDELLAFLNIEVVETTERGLRDGVIADLAGR